MALKLSRIGNRGGWGGVGEKGGVWCGIGDPPASDSKKLGPNAEGRLPSSRVLVGTTDLQRRAPSVILRRPGETGVCPVARALEDTF